MELSPSLGVLPPFGATTSLRGSLSWRWVTLWGFVTIPWCPLLVPPNPIGIPNAIWVALWGCHHPSVSCPHLVSPNPIGVPNAMMGDTLGLSPSLCVLSPSCATTSHKGPQCNLGHTLGFCHHPSVSCLHLVPPNPIGVPNAMMGDTLGLSPSLAVLPPSGATKFHQWSPVMLLGDTLELSPSLCVPSPFGATTSLRGSLSWRWVTLWGCHHPLVSPFGATKSHRGPQCNDG